MAREELRTDDLTGLSESLYNASKPVKLLIHPWLGVPIMVPVIFPFSAKNCEEPLYHSLHDTAQD